jgi:hypothetical protein
VATLGGPCENWPVRWVCDVSCESPTVTGEAVTLATEVVWALSGRQFGLCEVTLRPCRLECAEVPWPSGGYSEWAGTQWISPSLIAGQWFNVVCGRCTMGCSCSSLSEVVLPAPVHSVVQVKIDGVVVTGSAYRLDDNRRVVLLDAEWPTCQELNLPDTEPNTWSITARYGLEVPEGGAWAVGELACELIRARNGEDCRLPRNVTQLVRQGVTIQFPNTIELLREGLTGLYLVDQFITTWNPGGLRRRSGVYSVDRPPHRRVGT